VESTKPTKNLMSIAEYIDTNGDGELRDWFANSQQEVATVIVL